MMSLPDHALMNSVMLFHLTFVACMCVFRWPCVVHTFELLNKCIKVTVSHYFYFQYSLLYICYDHWCLYFVSLVLVTTFGWNVISEMSTMATRNTLMPWELVYRSKVKSYLQKKIRAIHRHWTLHWMCVYTSRSQIIICTGYVTIRVHCILIPVPKHFFLLCTGANIAICAQWKDVIFL